jgi:hypothetical protein
MYICNTEVYGSKELFQTGKIDDPLYGKISLTYRFSIMDEFFTFVISMSYIRASSSEKTGGSTLHARKNHKEVRR